MLTVRFPDGTAVQYNNALYYRVGKETIALYTADPAKEGAFWVATIPAATNCIIESSPACRVYNALHTEAQLRTLLARIRDLNGSAASVLVEMKTVLKDFNATTRRWK